MKKFVFDIEDFCEDVFHKLEYISEGNQSHICEINTNTKEEAARILATSLRLFIENQFEEVIPVIPKATHVIEVTTLPAVECPINNILVIIDSCIGCDYHEGYEDITNNHIVKCSYEED